MVNFNCKIELDGQNTDDRVVENSRKSRNNAEDLAKELGWLADVIKFRLNDYFGGDQEDQQTWPQPPDCGANNSVYARFVTMYQLNGYERLALVLAIAPAVNPSVLDAFFTKDTDKGKAFTCFGGVANTGHSGFIPTGETFMFLASGIDLSVRFRLQDIFSADHAFAKNGVLALQGVAEHDPFLSGAIILSREFLDLFTHGNIGKPVFGKDFPAKEVTTTYEWEDLVLNPVTLEEISELSHWVKYGRTIMEDWGLQRKLKPGYRTLFYGPPGTGKTLTATLLAKMINKPLYRIDLSMVVSKYIGETEKNLSSVFDQAENKDWILFFDEADALFGKRTKVNDAHDRYANQEVSYLLQRIEDFPGVVILASNFKSNLDEAFTRRFQSMIHFPAPTSEERYVLWKKSFSELSVLEANIDLEDISEKYEVTGGSIMNVVRYVSLLSVARESNIILKKDLIDGIRREFRKDGKLF